MNNKNHECDRKEDLITYLYGEATATEKKSFEQHLNECKERGEELKASGRVGNDLRAWQVGFAPRTELVFQRSKLDVLRELISLFPFWARGLAMAGAAAVIVVAALSVYSLKSSTTTATALSEQQVQVIVSKAVADERAKMQQQNQAEFASFKTQLAAEYQTQLQAASAEHQNKLEAVKASLKAELKKSNQQNGSLRSFFAVEDDRSYPWGDSR